MCQMVVTGERYVFYFGIFICGATLNNYFMLLHTLILHNVSPSFLDRNVISEWPVT